MKSVEEYFLKCKILYEACKNNADNFVYLAYLTVELSLLTMHNFFIFSSHPKNNIMPR